MRFCVDVHQSEEYLKKAGEIIVDWNNRTIIDEFTELYPQAFISLKYPANSQEVSIKELKSFQLLCRNKFLYITPYLAHLKQLVAAGIRCCYAIPVRDFYTLSYIQSLGISAVYITAPLTHCLKELNKFTDMEMRIVINDCGITADTDDWNGITGGWFRPEDVDNISEYFDSCEFLFNDKKQEQALFRIYAENKFWPGTLDLIIPNINKRQISNYSIPPEFFERRANCGQACAAKGSCIFCYLISDISNPIKLNKIKRSFEE